MDPALDNEDFQEEEFYTKYEPMELLGKGLSSTVRKCVSRETGKEYAVKIIDRSIDDNIFETIKAEVEMLRYLPQHDHIILLQDVFQSQAFVFLVFEIANCELFDYLTQHVKLSEKRTRHLMRQLFLAVDHMHCHNVVHRDLKPENILLDYNEVLKVSDFGFATIVREGQLLKELLGTPGYLAPEMLQVSVGNPDYEGYGKEIDLWACGVIMYTLLAGFPPFWHRKRMIMLRDIMAGHYAFVSPEWDDISEGPKDLIRKLLVLNPSKRLTAAEALQHPWLQIRPIQESPCDPRRRFRAMVHCIFICQFLQTLKKPVVTLNMSILSDNPYEFKYVRKSLDACAFGMYGHWVKRGEQQNRAALFETMPKCRTSSSHFTVHGRSPVHRRQWIHKALRRTHTVME